MDVDVVVDTRTAPCRAPDLQLEGGLCSALHQLRALFSGLQELQIKAELMIDRGWSVAYRLCWHREQDGPQSRISRDEQRTVFA